MGAEGKADQESSSFFRPEWWTGWALALFLLLLPWESGVRIGRIVSLAVALLGAALIVYRDRTALRNMLPWLPPVAAVLGAIVLSSLFSMEPGFSFKTLTRQHLWFFLTFLAVSVWAVNPGRQWFLVRTLAVTGAVSATAGIALYHFAETWHQMGWIARPERYVYTAYSETGEVYRRAQGTMHSYTRSAMIFMVTIPAVAAWLAWAARRRSWHEVAFVVSLLALSIAYLFLTKARGAWIGAGIGGFAAFLAAGGRFRVAGPALAVVVLAGLALPSVRDRAETFVSHLSEPELLLSGRIDLWGQGIRPIRENLWFGVGYGGNIFLQQGVMEQYELITDRRQPDLHQLYLQTLAEVGIVGSIAYAWFLGFLIVHCVTGLRRAGIPPDPSPGLATAVPVIASFLILGSIYYFNEEQVAHLLFATAGLAAAKSREP